MNRLLNQLGAKRCTADHVIAAARSAIEQLHSCTLGYEKLSSAFGSLFKREPKKAKVIAPPRAIITAPFPSSARISETKSSDMFI